MNKTKRFRSAVLAFVMTGGALAGVTGVVDAQEPDPEPTTTTTEVETTTTTEGETTTTTEPEDEYATGTIQVSNVACEVTIVASVSMPYTYSIEVWDDGELIDVIPFTMDAAGDRTLSYTVTSDPGQEAPGVGFYLMQADFAELDTVDPYEVMGCGPATDGSGGQNGQNGSAPSAKPIVGSPSYTG